MACLEAELLLEGRGWRRGRRWRRGRAGQGSGGRGGGKGRDGRHRFGGSVREKARVEGFGRRGWRRRGRWELDRHRELLGRRRRRRGWGRRRSRGKRRGLLEGVWGQEVPRRAGEPLLQGVPRPVGVQRLAHGRRCTRWRRRRRRRGRKCYSVCLWRRRCWGRRNEGRRRGRAGRAQPQHRRGRPGGRHGRWRGWRRGRRDIGPRRNVIHVGSEGHLGCGRTPGQNLVPDYVEVTGQPVVTGRLSGHLVLQPGDGAELVHGGSR